ncbi:DgyrCDS124 [Dimorphilus gyrociliatus]|uniref:DgyrCDS124 n=1 Tax=Dimorphilus gyrociliatus TaxID=2664684 RepID=A0A7I8V5D7_9ANNE|nr:DgyrCDS124 [Dimorphilus gyrociliatus]
MASVSKTKKLNKQEILIHFEQLRMQQKTYAQKISELKMEIREHELVLKTLQEVDPERRCYRMVGTVTVERTVKDVIPALAHNCVKLNELIKSLEKQLEQKGKEINEYREKYDIQFRNERDEGKEEKTAEKPKSTGVLVGGSN